jgi:hypothetical protein
MFSFLFGLFTGIYVGTHYDCKPVTKKLGDLFKKFLPPRGEETRFWNFK